MSKQNLVLPFLLFIFLLAVSTYPENAYPQDKKPDYLKSGITNLKEENYEEAIADLKKAREEDPNSSVAAYFLGIAYKKVQDYKEAKHHLNDAITLKPAVKEGVVELADTFYQLGELEDALKTLEIAEREDISPAQTVFLKGLVLLKTRKNLEAIEAFKKAKSLDEKLSRSADYQIGIANLQEGKLSEAREVFKEVVVRDPNADIAQFANQYINAIAKRLKEERPFRVTLGIQYMYDDNVLLKPSDSAAAGDITGEGDSVGVATLRAEYVPKLTGPWGMKLQYSLYYNIHEDLKTHDIQSHTAALIPSYNFKDSSISLLTSYNYTLVDDFKYVHSVTVLPQYSFVINQNQFAQAFVRYQFKDFLKKAINSDENRDSNDYAVGGSWFYLFAENKGFLNLRYEFNKENTDGKNWEYHGNKFSAGFLYPVMEKLKLNIGLEAYLQKYEETHTAFDKKRKDETYTFNTMLSYSIYEDIDIQAQYSHIKSNSNITVYDYDRNIVSIGIEARF
ncbi:MAG TPA: hypothetical protein DD641_00190 [Deltaproteobacteria bacterium]|nr:hypothetical protein [Deltaproteobacteria bacterium]